MFRNVCFFVLVVLCGHAASAMSTDMAMAVMTKMGGQVMSMGMACLAKSKGANVMKDPSPANVVLASGCLAGCAAEGIGMMKDDGSIDTSAMEKAIPEGMPMGAEVKQIFKDCGGKAADKCDSVLSFIKCVFHEEPFKKIIGTIKSYGTELVVAMVKAAMYTVKAVKIKCVRRFIVRFALPAFTLSSQPPHDAILEKCKINRSVTEDLLSNLHLKPEPLLRDPETRCFTACILTENRTLKPDGTLSIAALIEYLPKNMANRQYVIEAFNCCANEKGVDSCETAYKTVVCANSKDVIRNMRQFE